MNIQTPRIKFNNKNKSPNLKKYSFTNSEGIKDSNNTETNILKTLDKPIIEENSEIEDNETNKEKNMQRLKLI
jgi:hypothetical protein